MERPSDLKAVRAVLAVMVMTAALTACGGSGNATGGSGDGSDANGDEAGSTSNVSESELADTSGPASGKMDRLIWGLPQGEPPSLDPSRATEYSPALVVGNLCDSLLNYEPDFSQTPNVASYKRVTPTEYVFTMRPGIRFWDGQEATVKDLVFSMEWAARPESVVSYIWENKKSIEITGPWQVTVKLKHPDELFIKELSALAAVLLEKEFTEKAGKAFGTSEGGIMCSGPFELGAWRQGEEIELVRNDNYWNREDMAHANVVSLKFLSDSASLAQGLASGEVEGAYGVPAAVIPRLENSSDGRLLYGHSLEYLSVWFARPDGPTEDIKLRKAIQLTLDRPAIAEVIYHEKAVPNYTVLSNNSFDSEAEQIYEEAYRPFEASNGYDLERAEQLVEESSYKGQTLRLATLAGNVTINELAQLLQQQASQIGVKVEIVPLQAAQYTTAAYTKSQRSDLDMYINVAFNLVKDPMEPLPWIFMPDEVYNWTDYSNPTVTALLKKARETYDPTKRAEMVVEMQKIYEEAVVGAVVVAPYTITYLNENLSGAITSSAWMWSHSLASIGPK